MEKLANLRALARRGWRMASRHDSVGGLKERRDAAEEARPVGIGTVPNAADQHDQHVTSFSRATRYLPIDERASLTAP